jgi:competence protein ComEA
MSIQSIPAPRRPLGAPILCALAVACATATVLCAPSIAAAQEGAPREEATARPKIELNSATVEQLLSLPGIGRTRAREIIRARTIRPFVRVADIMRVHGIGRRTYLKLRPLVRVSQPGQDAEPSGASGS